MIKRFLTFDDYNTLIKQDDLSQILGSKEGQPFTGDSKATLLEVEQVSQEEISSYIRGRYIVDQIFAPTQDFSTGSTYFGKNLVVYKEPIFNTGTTYNAGQRCSYLDNIYECISGSTAGDFPNTAATEFNFIVENEQFFYANLPCQEYNINTNYIQNTLVWFEDNIYKAKQNIIGTNPAQSQNLELRYGIPSVQGYLGIYNDTGISGVGIPNPVPNVNTNFWQLYNGQVSSWFSGTTYYFSGQVPTNTTYWTQGDNRNPQVKMYLIDIILYHLHSRINPRNIPELRAIRYDGDTPQQNTGAIGWLKNIEKGKVNLNCPEIEPAQGGNIRFGSYPKASNWY